MDLSDCIALGVEFARLSDDARDALDVRFYDLLGESDLRAVGEWILAANRLAVAYDLDDLVLQCGWAARRIGELLARIS